MRRLWKIFYKKQMFVAVALSVFIFLIHAYIFSESSKDNILGALLVCWSLFPALLFIYLGRKMAKYPSFKFAFFVTGWSVLLAMLLFAFFVFATFIENGGLFEGSLMYLTPLVYPVIFVPPVFVLNFVLACIYNYFRTKCQFLFLCIIISK